MEIPSVEQEEKKDMEEQQEIDPEELAKAEAVAFEKMCLELKLVLDTKSKELNDLRRARADRLLIKHLDQKLLVLKVEYFEKVGMKFAISAEEIGYEFVYNYYDVLDNERNVSALLPYYKKNSSLMVDNFAKFRGQAGIIKALTVIQ